jgi:hypothetical protein
MERINPTAAAVNRILRVNKYNKDGTLRLIGTVTTEKVTIKQPAVVVGIDGVTELDPDNAAHWTDTTFDTETYTLDANNTARGVPYTGVWLVVKEAGAADNEFGVEYV